MESSNYINLSKKTGEEHLFIKDEELDIKLINFWRWNQSDLLSNSLKNFSRISSYSCIRCRWRH